MLVPIGFKQHWERPWVWRRRSHNVDDWTCHQSLPINFRCLTGKEAAHWHPTVAILVVKITAWEDLQRNIARAGSILLLPLSRLAIGTRINEEIAMRSLEGNANIILATDLQLPGNASNCCSDSRRGGPSPCCRRWRRQKKKKLHCCQVTVLSFPRNTSCKPAQKLANYELST